METAWEPVSGLFYHADDTLQSDETEILLLVCLKSTEAKFSLKD